MSFPYRFGGKTHHETVVGSTTRMIQRTVAGHLHHPAYRKGNTHEEEEEEEKVTAAAPRKNNRLSKVFFQRKPTKDWEATRAATAGPSSVVSTTTDKVFIVTPSKIVEDTNDDAELLTDDNRLEAWASAGLVGASAGDGPDTVAKPKDEKAKTLSDQVAEGKYGLIQKEIFQTTPKRPGIISYKANPEVPSDTAENLGGLNEEDIWLAEDHLLVIRGGHLNTAGSHSQDAWRPIDDYEAPQRQVKLPDNPKVPPPFLVQLEENGPLKFIGNHQLPLINPFTNQSLLLFPNGSGFPQADTHDTDQKNVFTRPRPTGPVAPDLGYEYPPPVPTWMKEGAVDGMRNETLFNPFLLPPVMRIPILPPKGSLDDSYNNNVTDYFDEDDPSLYYPPPYSFTYESNYTNPVPPGPLVPGIVLPPPPNFFTKLTPSKSSTTTSTAKPISKQHKPFFRTTTTTQRTTSTSQPTSTTSTTTTTSTTAPRIILKPRTTMPPQLRTTPDQIRTIVRPVYQTTTPRIVTQLRKVVSPQPIRPQQPESVLSFVSKDEPRPLKTNPVYYEYYDARTEAKTIKTTSTTTSTPAPVPLKLKPSIPVQRIPSTTTPIPANTQLRAQPQPKPRPYNAYLPSQPFDYERYVYITPKPEITPNGISNHVTTSGDDDDDQDTFVPLRKVPSRPVEVFRQEVDSIRQTLEYFKEKQQQQQRNSPYSSTPAPSFYEAPPQRSAKAKAVYEYSFDAATASPLLNDANIFLPPSKYDTTPFKPMVQYSPPLNEAGGFKAMSYSTTTELSAPVKQANRLQAARNYVPKEQQMQGFFRPPSTPVYDYQQQQKQQQQQQSTFIGGISTTTPEPWLSFEKQLFRQVQNAYPKEINVQIQPGDIYGNYYNNRPRNQYQYQPQQPYFRPNHRVQQQQQHQQYLLQQQQQQLYHHQQQQQHQIQQQIQQQNHQQQTFEYNLANDTAVNYLHPRPPINPDAEFIDPALLNQDRVYSQQQQQQQSPSPLPQPFPPPPLPQRPSANGGPQYYPIPVRTPSLVKDVLVNYKLPLPQSNAYAEYIAEDRYGRYYNAQPDRAVQSSSGGQQQQTHPVKESGVANSDVVRYKLPGDQEANVFFYTPSRRQRNR